MDDLVISLVHQMTLSPNYLAEGQAFTLLYPQKKIKFQYLYKFLEN